VVAPDALRDSPCPFVPDTGSSFFTFDLAKPPGKSFLVLSS
jgi:hypothetical protein